MLRAHTRVSIDSSKCVGLGASAFGGDGGFVSAVIAAWFEAPTPHFLDGRPIRPRFSLFAIEVGGAVEADGEVAAKHLRRKSILQLTPRRSTVAHNF